MFRSSIDRRRFLGITSGAAAASLLDPPRLDAAGAHQSISIIHTTDLHGHILPTETYEGITDVGGFARCATQIRRWQRDFPNHLLIDVGDLYQGTLVSRQSGGLLMMDLLNHLNYDAWVLGNHEFDWGIGTVENVVARAAMPVVTGNLKVAGRPAGQQKDDGHPFSKIAPWIIREVAGFKIGIVGLITPGLPFWLRPEMLKGLEVFDPVIATKNAIAAMKSAGVDCIIAAGHMGSKWGKDDFANRVHAVVENHADIDVFLAGHTHRDHPGFKINRTLYSQAGYYGIHVGRVDLTFSLAERKLIDKRAFTQFVNSRLEGDPVVLAKAQGQLEAAKLEGGRVVARLSAPLSATSEPGKPSQILRLTARAIQAAIAKKGTPVDGVIHGQFVEKDIPAGPLTVRDIWKLIPYENLLVTAEITAAQIRAVLDEAYNIRYSNRNLVGFKTTAARDEQRNWRLATLVSRDGSPLDPAKRYRIAFNSYDAQSGGNRLTTLASILKEPDVKSTFHQIETRDALLEHLATRDEIDPAKL